MSCLNCFGSRRQHTNSVSSSVNADGTEVFIDDLVLNPKRIDARLENRIAEWQNAINDYQAFEDICREEIEEELIPILEDLRERPQDYRDKKKFSVNVQALALKLIKVQELQSLLESSKRDDDSSSFGTRLKYYLCFPCRRPAYRNSDAGGSGGRDTVHVSVNHSMSDKLSAKWALRLNEINPTQGSLHRGSASMNTTPFTPGSHNLVDPNAPIKIKPKWPDFLIDTYFDVIKINMYGRKMRRIIKLNQHFVVNITNGTEISKFYAYREIRRVWLESGNTIVVVLKNGKQSVYMSHIAPHVLQQITTRVQVRRSLDKAEFYGPAFSLGYSSAVTAGIIKSISEENTMDSEAVVALFASELKERTVRSIRGDSSAPPASPSTGSGKYSGGEGSARRENNSVAATLPTLVEEDEMSAASNPLHAPATAATAAKNPAVSPFAAPFSNAVNDGTASSSDGHSPQVLSRTVTNNSENSASEMSYHTADSIPSTAQPSSAAASASSAATEAPRLLSLSEGMPEYYVQSAVQTLIFDTSTSEGNTRKIFIDKFKAACIVSLAQSALTSASARGAMHLGGGGGGSSSGTSMSSRKSGKAGQGATLLEVRHFIDGMHEYILGNRGVSLALLYEREKQRAIILNNSAPTSSGALSGGDASPGTESGQTTGGGSSTPPTSTHSPGGRGITRGNSKRGILQTKNGVDQRAFQSANTTAVVEAELTSRASLQFLKDNNLDLSMIDEKIVIFISFVVFMVVEEAIFLPLKADLINLLPSSSKQEEELMLLEKMRLLSVRSQQQWGIPEELVSPLGWQSAIFELQGLEHNLTPSTQLHVLTRTVKAIYNEFKHVILPTLQAKGVSQSCIAADDLVPIFIFIFCRSNLKHPMRSRDLMWSLCHPDQLQGEGGYYLTVFESSIEFVLNEEVSRDSFVFSYNSTLVSAADEASKQYVSGLRSSLSGNMTKWVSGNHGRLFSNGSRSSSGQFADAMGPGGVFDISGDYIDNGVQSNRSSGSAGSSPGVQQRGSAHQHARHLSSGSTGSGSYGEARGTLSGRDSIINTLANRLTLSNLLTRKPAPDNTTRESFN